MKDKTSAPASVPQRYIYSRISYLHQAAGYLTQRHLSEPKPDSQDSYAELAPESRVMKPTDLISIEEAARSSQHQKSARLQSSAALSRYLLSNVHGVSLKGQVRLDSTLKHSICRRCNAFLVAGVTSTSYVENRSNGGEKSWADVLVLTCKLCDATRRFPIGAMQQRSKKSRQKQEKGLGVESG